jgi:hypothetical protein
VSWAIHLEADIVQLSDAPGGRDRVGLQMHLEAEIEYLRDTLEGHDRASLEMHCEALIQSTQRCTWRS